MKKIITISREFGAGGGEIGRAVAERLGYYYCDRDIIIRAAGESGSISPEVFRQYDEQVPHSVGFGQSLFIYNKPLNEKLFEAQKEAIRKIGEHGKCVIVGRNANTVLKEYDDSLHVFVSATDYFCLQRMRERMPGYTDEKILEEKKVVDRRRRKYCSYYTNTEFGNAEFYDLCLKSSSLGIQKCIDIICDIAQ